MLANDVPADCRVLAVYVENLVRPFSDLRQRVDQIDHLMAGFPFDADMVIRRFVEHQFPGIRVVRDVPVAGLPVAIHGAVFKGDLHALVGGAFCKLAPDFLISGKAFRQRFAAKPAGETRNAGRAEMVGIVDAVFPALQCLKVDLGFFQRIAEHAERADGDVALADRVKAALAELGKVLTVGGLPEERLEAFKAEIGDLADTFGRLALGGADHGADADGCCRIAHVFQSLCCN
ncbi:hypothetical protein D3C87_1175230 [compost metagenome]